MLLEFTVADCRLSKKKLGWKRRTPYLFLYIFFSFFTPFRFSFLLRLYPNFFSLSCYSWLSLHSIPQPRQSTRHDWLTNRQTDMGTCGVSRPSHD